jgi:gliding motility-associated-like protein
VKSNLSAYLIIYIVLVNLQSVSGQVTNGVDSLVKQWELNGIPLNHKKDYQEYISNRHKIGDHHNHDTHTQTQTQTPTHKTTTASLCYNPGFELSDFSNWVRSTGKSTTQGTVIPVINYNNTSSNNYSFNSTVFAPESFAIHSVIASDSITGVGYDHYSYNGSQYNFKPTIGTGGNYSARIGNANPSYKASKIEYEFTVTGNEPFLIYNYAFVLSDGSHWDGEQASFSVKLTDSVDNVVALGNLPYMVNANSALTNSDFKLSAYQSNVYDVYYKKWVTDTINLCQYVGRTFKLVYEAIDCIYGAHFCYAYVDAKCGNIYIEPGKTISCRDSLNTGFVAPPGYNNYQWIDSHGNVLSAAQTGNQEFLNFNTYLQNCSTGNCTIDNNDVFTLNVTTNLGCVLTTTYSVKNYSINISAASQIASCEAGHSGSINLTPSGGLNNSSYNFSWYGNNCTGNIISTSNPLTNVPAGDYCVHITSGNCAPIDTVIHVSALPTEITLSQEQLPSCIDSTYTIHSPTGSGYTWYQNNSPLTNQTSDSLMIDPMDLNSDYTLVYIDMLGCKDSTKFQISPANNNSTFSLVACPNDSIGLFVSPTSYNPPNYQWYLNGVAVSNSGQNDSIKISVNEAHNLFVSYYTDNCKKIASDFVKVFPEQLFLPDKTTNVFTPNNDGANDFFFPYEHSLLYSPKAVDLETSEYELTVFNRWGTLIFRAIQYSDGWNGKTIDDLPSIDGTYFWIASYISNCSNKTEKTIKKGFVQLLR